MTHEKKYLSIVTAYVFNADGDIGVAATTVNADLAAAKANVLEEALETFNEDFYDACGIIYHVDKVEIPELRSATITSDPQAESLNVEILK